MDQNIIIFYLKYILEYTTQFAEIFMMIMLEEFSYPPMFTLDISSDSIFY